MLDFNLNMCYFERANKTIVSFFLGKLRICREERERIIRNPSNRSKFLQICDKHSVLDSKHSDEVRPTSEYRSAEQWIDDAPRWTDILRNEASGKFFPYALMLCLTAT